MNLDLSINLFTFNFFSTGDNVKEVRGGLRLIIRIRIRKTIIAEKMPQQGVAYLLWTDRPTQLAMAATMLLLFTSSKFVNGELIIVQD
jgi:hypothetical protein